MSSVRLLRAFIVVLALAGASACQSAGTTNSAPEDAKAGNGY